jgi:hypothetical protein
MVVVMLGQQQRLLLVNGYMMALPFMEVAVVLVYQAVVHIALTAADGKVNVDMADKIILTRVRVLALVIIIAAERIIKLMVVRHLLLKHQQCLLQPLPLLTPHAINIYISDGVARLGHQHLIIFRLQ